MQELVSVIVPIYNVEQYLEECIQSIVDQTYRNLEIILVDDGSPDNCPVICDGWAQKDARIKVIHKTNAGLGMARNTGMDQATGRYIFFLDSDDYVDHTLVEKCVRNAREHQSDVVVYGCSNVYGNGRIEDRKLSTKRLSFCGEDVKSDLLPYLFTYELGFGVSAWGKMYRLQTLQTFGLRFKSEREIISEDSYFALELFSKVTTVTIVPECLYFYRKRENSLSRKYQKDRQNRNNTFLTKSMEFADRAKLPPKVAMHIQSRYHGFTLGTMMQIVRSDLTWQEKHSQLHNIYTDPLLRSTLTREVCRLDARIPQLFWCMLKLRCHVVCTALLYANTHR